jgi:hypothetical protein
MNAASEALFVGNTLEKLTEPFVFFLGQYCQEFLLVVARDFSDQFHSVATVLCEVKGMPSSIIRISAALDKPFRLQIRALRGVKSNNGVSRTKRTLSAAAWRRIAAAQRARWAKIRARKK